MPGDIYGVQTDYGAGYGYAMSGFEQTQIVQGGGSDSHHSFLLWLLVFTLGSVVVLHGLKVGGFTFVFRR